MSTYFKERYTATLINANGTAAITGGSTGGFLAKTAGTITLTDANGNILVNAHPVTAGTYYPLPFLMQTLEGQFTCAGGASGTLGT